MIQNSTEQIKPKYNVLLIWRNGVKIIELNFIERNEQFFILRSKNKFKQGYPPSLEATHFSVVLQTAVLSNQGIGLFIVQVASTESNVKMYICYIVLTVFSNAFNFSKWNHDLHVFESLLHFFSSNSQDNYTDGNCNFFSGTNRPARSYTLLYKLIKVFDIKDFVTFV